MLLVAAVVLLAGLLELVINGRADYLLRANKRAVPQNYAVSIAARGQTRITQVPAVPDPR